jgi:activator of 2-hydroxyglutaryl-CoA dehydratase
VTLARGGNICGGSPARPRLAPTLFGKSHASNSVTSCRAINFASLPVQCRLAERSRLILHLREKTFEIVSPTWRFSLADGALVMAQCPHQ